MRSKEVREAIYAREVASAYYLSNPRVRLIDIGWKIKDGKPTKTLAVRVHVRSKPSEGAIESLYAVRPDLVIEKSMIPFESDIIEAKYPLQQYSWDYPSSNLRWISTDPLEGGISVSGEWVFGSGTLGGIVEDRVTKEKMILSNWHVLAGSDYGVPGTSIFQPGYGDYGSEVDTVALLERHSFGNGIDAAVARLTGARGWQNNQRGIGDVTGCIAPELDMLVTKSGRTSEVTWGKVDGFAGEYPIYYNGVLHSIKHVIRIVPQRDGSEVSLPGDSGSWWLKQETREAIGLHFAGQDAPDPEVALAIAMPQVLDALNVDIAGVKQPVVTPERTRELVPA